MKESGSSHPESHSETTYREYVTELKLSQEDLQRHILDVGARMGDFATEAKKRGYGDIVSADILHPNDQGFESEKPYGAGQFVVGDALQLPFKDNEFDLVLSIYAIPVMLDHRTMREETVQAILEMLRTTKPGGEVRLAGVAILEKPLNEPNADPPILQALEDLVQRGIKVVVEDSPTNTERRYDKNYLIRLKKAASQIEH